MLVSDELSDIGAMNGCDGSGQRLGYTTLRQRLRIGALSSVYANIHDVSDEAFVRIDLLHGYMHTRLLCHKHFVSLIIAHQLFLVDIF
jgi:hypothetical protein